MSKLLGGHMGKEDTAILDWLAKIDYTAQQIDVRTRRQPETGEWLLRSAEFEAWLGTEKHILFCPGIPGAGKTILTSLVVDHLTEQLDSSVGIAYLYCSFQSEDQNECGELLAGLLKQLAKGLSSLPEPVKTLYNEHRENKQIRPTMDDISKALQQVVPMYKTVFIIIDAVDECYAAKGNRSRFLSTIFKLQENTNTKLFATSRQIPDIEELFKDDLTVEIRAHHDDICKYLDSRMPSLPKFVSKKTGLEREISSKIAAAVEGM